MQIIEKSVNDLTPYENNPRNNDAAVGPVANSIKEFGFKVPIVIDSAGVIVSGHTRLKAAQHLRLKSVPCVVADDLTPEQIKAFRLADNKVSEFAEWNSDSLELELAELSELNMDDFGFETVIFDDGFSTDFELPSDDKPQARTITLTLCEEQFDICEKVIEMVGDNTPNNFGNHNKRSNSLFEVVFEWAEQKKLL